jgi:ribokinase
MTKKIAVIGSSNMDLIMQVDRLPKPGETVSGGIFSTAFGGKGANQAVGAARAGGEVVFVSCIGNDGFTADLLNHFKSTGLDTRFVFQDKETSTGTALIMVDQNGENCISVAPGANYKLTQSHIDQVFPSIEKDFLILLQCELHRETLYYTLDKTIGSGLKVILNLAPAIALPHRYLENLFLLIVNESEAASLSGLPVRNLSEAQQAAHLLRERGCNGVIVTMGAKGAFVSFGDILELVPAFHIDAVDTTAAGDIFCGCLVAALTGDVPILEAVRFASAGAAISATRLGAQPSAPSREEIETFMKNQR